MNNQDTTYQNRQLIATKLIQKLNLRKLQLKEERLMMKESIVELINLLITAVVGSAAAFGLFMLFWALAGEGY